MFRSGLYIFEEWWASLILANYMITNLLIFICFRSFSAMNLATKFASNIKRKMSDQHIVQFQGRTRTRSAFLTTAASPTATASYQSNLKTRSGVLYVYSRSRRTFQVRYHKFLKAAFNISISGNFASKKCQTGACIKYDRSITHFFY